MGAPIALAASSMSVYAWASAKGSTSEEFSGHRTTSGFATLPALTFAASLRVSLTW